MAPVFNVVPPFNGVTVVHLNEMMADILYNCLKNLAQNNDQDAQDFLKAFDNPGRSIRGAVGLIQVIQINSTTILILQMAATENLTSILQDEIEYNRHMEPQLRAMCRALEDPYGCQESRLRRRSESDREPRPQWAGRNARADAGYVPPARY